MFQKCRIFMVYVDKSTRSHLLLKVFKFCIETIRTKRWIGDKPSAYDALFNFIQASSPLDMGRETWAAAVLLGNEVGAAGAATSTTGGGSGGARVSYQTNWFNIK